MSEDTVDLYLWVLEKLCAEFPDDLPATRGELQPLLVNNTSLSLASQRTIWNRLRVFWSWLGETGVCDSNPMLDMPSPMRRQPLPRVLSKEEVDRFLAAAPVERDHAILAVLLDTGLRAGELASMTRAGCRSDGLTVVGKVGHRVVPVSPGVFELMMRQGDGEHIWVGPKGALSRSGVQQVVRRCMRLAGFKPPKIGPHALRHTFGVQYMVNGGDTSSLQTIMGHTKIETTMLYVRLSSAQVAEQHRRFSPMRNLVAAD